VRRWQTGALAAPDQFRFWREVVWEAFTPVALSRTADGPFRGEVAAWRVGPVGVSLIASESQRVMRTPVEIARRAGDTFFLNLPLTDGPSADQAGRIARLSRGDFAIVDAASPFELAFPGAFRQISLMLPHDLLAPLLVAPGQATAVRVRGSTGIGAVASAAVQALARSCGSLDAEAGRALASRLVDLVALSVGSVAKAPASANRALLLQAAQDAIERSLGDPQLSPPQVAERVGVSVSYLHRLFADTGSSFGRWTLARRLDRARRELEDPVRRHWTIAQVALEYGFEDPGHFSRAFKARFGVTPRQARAASGADCGVASRA
jgi:AraC family transcriptional regulator, positive regulator of tynA and feaB